MTRNIEKDNKPTINVYAPSNTYIEKVEVNSSKDDSTVKKIAIRVAAGTALGLLGIPML